MFHTHTEKSQTIWCLLEPWYREEGGGGGGRQREIQLNERGGEEIERKR